MLRYGIEASKYAIFYLLFTLLCTLLSLLFSIYLFIKYFWFPIHLFWGLVRLAGVVVWFLWVCFGRVVSGVINAGVLVVEGVVLRVWRVRVVREMGRWKCPMRRTRARGRVVLSQCLWRPRRRRHRRRRIVDELLGEGEGRFVMCGCMNVEGYLVMRPSLVMISVGHVLRRAGGP